VVELDQSGTDTELAALLPRPREVLERVAAEATGEDRLERPPLAIVSALVDVEPEVPGRPRLVVVVAAGERDVEPRQLNVSCPARFDVPGERAEADPVRRAAAGNAVDLPARTDGVAAARFEVRAGDSPGRQSGRRRYSSQEKTTDGAERRTGPW
jgi:hypothetical protein